MLFMSLYYKRPMSALIKYIINLNVNAMLKKILKVSSKSLIVMTLAFMCQNLLAQQLIQTPTDSEDSGSAIKTTTETEATTTSTGSICYIESWYPTGTNIYFSSEGGSYTFS
jgi:hypothetical protein